MTVGLPTIGEAVARYVDSLPIEERGRLQQELVRFLRWFGSDQPIDAINARALESYQEQVANSGADQTRRLEPLRAFLNYAQRQGHLASNHAKYIKLKRAPKTGRVEGSILEEEVTPLTADGYDRLKAELERLLGIERPKVAQELWEARLDKDIRENAPYDAAKQHQALVEARIRELEHSLATARIIQEGQSSERITVGSKVVLRDLTHNEDLGYTLVGPQEANPRGGKISIASPVGRALLDRWEGDVIEVEAPVGTVRYRVERIER